VVIVPLTTTPKAEEFPILVSMPSMGVNTKARTEHIRSIDKSRLGRYEGEFSESDLVELGRAIGKVLKLI
jgi:mRNA-degrading endonuclease toxin of MazEF toxin-antitoxin module